jgi:hypothetical protein
MAEVAVLRISLSSFTVRFLEQYPRIVGNLRPDPTYSAERRLKSLEISPSSSAAQMIELARIDSLH